MKTLGILFAGSPAIAVPSLLTLSEMELEGRCVALKGILTNPDSRKGRGGQEGPTDISAAASALDTKRREKGFPVLPQLKYPKLDSMAREETARLAPDLLVSFAYGRFFGPRFLALFPLGGINIHPSLLPKYRGASPIPAAILAGEKKTGICIQKLAPEMDTGDILAEETLELSGRETSMSLGETVSRRAALLLRELLEDFDNRMAFARPQAGDAVFCREIHKNKGFIDWNKSAMEIDAQIRAYNPWPLSFTRLGDKALYILEAMPCKETPEYAKAGISALPGTVLGMDNTNGVIIQTGNGILSVFRLQWQGKKAMDFRAFCNGARDFIGARLGYFFPECSTNSI